MFTVIAEMQFLQIDNANWWVLILNHKDRGSFTTRNDKQNLTFRLPKGASSLVVTANYWFLLSK